MISHFPLLAQFVMNLQQAPMFVPFGQLSNPLLQRLVFFFNRYGLFNGIPAARAAPSGLPNDRLCAG